MDNEKNNRHCSYEKFKETAANVIENECDVYGIRQTSRYSKDNKPVPDNNMFFEERHNPLSSKGN